MSADIDAVHVRQDRQLKKQQKSAKKEVAAPKAKRGYVAKKDRSGKADKDAKKRNSNGTKHMRVERGTARAARRAISSYYYGVLVDGKMTAHRTGMRSAAPIGAKVVYAESKVAALLKL